MADKWGIALAGGGTRGAYHLGAWKAIKEMGLEIGTVVGTSIGSVNGALFAQGDYEKAVQLWESSELSDVLELGDNFSNRDNLLDYKNFVPIFEELVLKDGLKTLPLQQLLESVIDEDRLRNSDMDFGLNTTSVPAMQAVKLFAEDIPKGKLVDAIMASSCFPGFQKKYIEDKAYADGGIVNNLPLDMLFSRGCRNIIAVDVGGVGIVRNEKCFDANIIYIRCQKPLIGIFDFNKKLIAASQKQAYYDTYKAFGRLMGNNYYFNISDYFKARGMYSQEIIGGIEIAAEAYGINNLAVYKLDSLIRGVLEGYSRHKKKDKEETLENILKLKKDNASIITNVAKMIIENRTEGLGNKLLRSFLGDRLSAAESIAYFVKNGK